MNEITQNESLPSSGDAATAVNPVRALLEQLNAQFPVIAQAQPLAIGIDKALFEQLPDVPRKHIRTALRVHTTSTRYLKSVARSTQRLDLQGQVAGEITEDQQAHAKEQLEERFAKAALARKTLKQQTRKQEVEIRRAAQQEKKLNALVEKFSKK